MNALAVVITHAQGPDNGFGWEAMVAAVAFLAFLAFLVWLLLRDA